MATGPLPVLWHIEISHYNEKTRWALDYKGIAHERRAPQPGLHMMQARRLAGISTFPILELEGRAIGDSTAIIAALEEYRPDPPLYPDDPAERERALELEDHFDERLAPEVRRLMFWHYLRSEAASEVLAEIVGDRGRLRNALNRRVVPLMKPMLSRTYGISDSEVEAAPDRIVAVFDRIQRERAGGDYLVGDRFTVADLTAAALMHPIARPAEFPYFVPPAPPSLQPVLERLTAHPAVGWGRAIYATHRRASAEVRAAA